MRWPSLIRLLFLLVLGPALLSACATSRPAPNEAALRAAVVGTWTYDVQGVAPLDQGRFHITVRDGRLRGLVRDRRLGRLQARVEVRDSRLELTLDDLKISGYIEDDQFTAFLRRDQWDVRTRRQTRTRSQFRSVSLYATRIRSAAVADKPDILECQSLLREASGCD
jgi:hypothetical protein